MSSKFWNLKYLSSIANEFCNYGYEVFLFELANTLFFPQNYFFAPKYSKTKSLDWYIFFTFPATTYAKTIFIDTLLSKFSWPSKVDAPPRIVTLWIKSVIYSWAKLVSKDSNTIDPHEWHVRETQ